MGGFAARHAEVCATFTGVVDGVEEDRWDAPSPVEGWVARDVVGHLVEWLTGLLAAASDVRLPAGPPVAADPAGAWRVHAAAVQAVLEDPGQAETAFSHPMAGTMTVGEAIDRLYTTDVFLHSWDLARATGQPIALDEATCEELRVGMGQIEELLRSSGQFGPAVPVPEDASAQDRLIGFIGRDPGWTPPTA